MGIQTTAIEESTALTHPSTLRSTWALRPSVRTTSTLRIRMRVRKKGKGNDEEVGELGGGWEGLAAVHTGNALPQYAPNPVAPTAGPGGYMKKMQAQQSEMDESVMPGGMPMLPPPDGV